MTPDFIIGPPPEEPNNRHIFRGDLYHNLSNYLLGGKKFIAEGMEYGSHHAMEWTLMPENQQIRITETYQCDDWSSSLCYFEFLNAVPQSEEQTHQ